MILAFDTSCYTTSIALMTHKGDLITDLRRVLTVPPGKRGLAQSEALFQHIHNLPEMLEQIKCDGYLEDIDCITASVKPRPRADSYMPVFLAGEKIGRSLAAVSDIPFVATTHQEGHLFAAIFSSDFPLHNLDAFLFCHFSGGTSEICAVSKSVDDYTFEIVSHGNDLHAGQFVDRVGVAMGLSFPAGQALEALGKQAGKDFPHLKTWVKDGEFSFSGPESALQRRLAAGLSHEDAARAVEDAIARTLEQALKNAMAQTGLQHVILAGGVMSNAYIKSTIESSFQGQGIWFAEAKYASDNAVGVAFGCRQKTDNGENPKRSNS